MKEEAYTIMNIKIKKDDRDKTAGETEAQRSWEGPLCPLAVPSPTGHWAPSPVLFPAEYRGWEPWCL